MRQDTPGSDRDRRATARLRWAAAARVGWGAALLLAPAALLRVVGRAPASGPALAVARVLGARQLVQAAVTASRPSRPVATVSAVVDALHAGTDLGLAAGSTRWRRIASIDAAVAIGLTACGWSARRR